MSTHDRPLFERKQKLRRAYKRARAQLILVVALHLCKKKPGDNPADLAAATNSISHEGTMLVLMSFGDPPLSSESHHRILHLLQPDYSWGSRLYID